MNLGAVRNSKDFRIFCNILRKNELSEFQNILKILKDFRIILRILRFVAKLHKMSKYLGIYT